MEFRLTYEGPLFAERSEDGTKQSRLKHQQNIRRKFHEQLKELWNTDQRLKSHREQLEAQSKELAIDNSKLCVVGGVIWLPLIQERMGAACSLEILFLRREPKGGIIQSGDLDNRIKTLFDCFRPPNENQIPDDLQPSSEPELFFCLLSDDKLITEFRVTADRFLVPSESQNQDSNVHLVIQVRTFVTDYIKAQWYVLADIVR